MGDFFIGIDMGGTNIRAIYYDVESKQVSKIYKKEIRHSCDVFKEAKDNLIYLIHKVCGDKKEGSLLGIGIALAALFERKTGIITEWSNNNKWKGFPIKMYLEEYFGVPVVLEDDANSAALGEQYAGEGKGCTDFIYITVSTGIGCGIIINGKLLLGTHGWSGEIGHIRVTDRDIICTCGNKGCLQAISSGKGILERYKEISFCKKIEEKNNLKLETVSELADRGVENAVKVFQDAGFYLGKAIGNTVMMLDVNRVILGGGVMHAERFIFNSIWDGINYSLQTRRNIEVVCSKLQDKNGLLGALANIYENYEKKEV